MFYYSIFDLNYIARFTIEFAFTIRNVKYLTFLFLEDNDSISAKFASQILSLNRAWDFLLLNFLITGWFI